VTRSATTAIPVIRIFAKHPLVELEHRHGLVVPTSVERRRAFAVTIELALRATDLARHVPDATIDDQLAS
jgi:hypothetical protein